MFVQWNCQVFWRHSEHTHGSDSSIYRKCYYTSCSCENTSMSLFSTQVCNCIRIVSICFSTFCLSFPLPSQQCSSIPVCPPPPPPPAHPSVLLSQIEHQPCSPVVEAPCGLTSCLLVKSRKKESSEEGDHITAATKPRCYCKSGLRQDSCYLSVTAAPLGMLGCQHLHART